MHKSLAQIGNLDCTIVRSTQTNQPATSVVILCHGFGAPGTDLVGIADQLIEAGTGLDQTEFIFPQAPIELDPMFDSRAWWMLDMVKIQELMAKGEFREFGSSKPPELPERRKAITEIINDAKTRHQIDDSKIILGGFSQGSMLSLDVALNFPGTLGGLILWSCAFINQEAWTELATHHAPMKIFQSHGTLDPILPYAGAEVLAKTLSDLGHQVEFCKFVGQHQIPMEGLIAVNRMVVEATGTSRTA